MMENLFLEGGAAVGCHMSQEALGQLNLFLRELLVWKQKINLTGLKDLRDIAVNLFIDSLAFSPYLGDIDQEISVLDIGTGAGFPGLALKIFHPSMNLTVIEPNQKKVAFLHHVIGVLGLPGVRVISHPIEGVKRRGLCEDMFDRILIKALKCSVCLPYLEDLLQPSGNIILWRARPLSREEDLCGFCLSREVFYELPFGYGGRVFSMLSLSEPAQL